MDWNTLALITYIFLLSLALLFITFILYTRLVRRRYSHSPADFLAASGSADGARKIDYQQIERVIQLHLDVKNDLANLCDVLVAIRKDSVTAQEDMQRQIDLCLEYIQTRERATDESGSMKPDGTAIKKTDRRDSTRRGQATTGMDMRDQVAELVAQGVEPDQITRKTGLSLNEVDLIMHLNRVR